MAIKVKTDRSPSEKRMSEIYAAALSAVAETNKNIVALDADLMIAIGIKSCLGVEYPMPTIDCGIQEANMIGVAAGMSIMGKIPFTHTFGPFATRRAFDQLFISGAYAGANIKMVGSDPGITAAYNGGTHMPFEDMGLILTVPGITALDITDGAMLKNLLPKIADDYGMYYMRFPRKDIPCIYEDGSDFEIGKAVTLREGTDVTIIASGFCVDQALTAADALEAEGISVRLLDMFTWKPIDEEAILKAAKETGVIVTAENHNVINGLGCAVCKVLGENNPIPVEMVGVKDEFGEVGSVEYLAERFGLTDKDIVKAVKKALERK